MQLSVHPNHSDISVVALEDISTVDVECLPLELLLAVDLHVGDDVTACKNMMMVKDETAPGPDITLLILSRNVYYGRGNLAMNESSS